MSNTQSFKYFHQTRGEKRDNKLGHYPYIDYIQISTIRWNVCKREAIMMTPINMVCLEFCKVQLVDRVVQCASFSVRKHICPLL